MKALLLSSYKNLELADLPAPTPAPDEVLIRVAACGICGSDVHGYDGSSGRRIPPLVVGAGTIGILTLQALRAAGCSKVFVTDVDAQRLELAHKLGAAETLLSDDSLLARILERTNNEGVDVALECVGRNETVAASIDATRKGGTVVLVGNIPPTVNLPLQKVVTRQIRLQGSCASAGEYPQAIESMASGKIQVKPLITAIAPLEEGPRWFERLYAREPNLLKVVLTPNAS